MKRLAEFCNNSRRWITLMAFKGKPPNTCPKQTDNFTTCEYCSYYEQKKESNYLYRIRKLLEGENGL